MTICTISICKGSKIRGVSFVAETVCISISFHLNILRKGMNPSLLFLSVNKIVKLLILNSKLEAKGPNKSYQSLEKEGIVLVMRLS